MSKEIAEVIDLAEERFVSIAPPKMNYEAEKGFVIQLLRNNDYLMKVATGNPQSLQQAITNVAAIGLSLNPAEKQAYLIPRNVKQGDKWVSKIFLEPSYMGLCKLATDSGSIEWIQANCVYENDTFLDNGAGNKPTHVYEAFGKNRGSFVGVFCEAKTHTGDYLTTVMAEEEIINVRDRSEAWKVSKSGPWKTDFTEQAKKTVVRRGYKMWPRSNQNNMLAEAVHLSNENEGFEPIITSPKIIDFTADQKNYFDQMIEKSDALGMYVFSESFDLNDASSRGASIWTNLLHSFPQGQKGKYQTLVHELRINGESLFFDVLAEIEELIGNDDCAMIELLNEFDDATAKLIENKLNPEMIMSFNRIRGKKE